MERGTGVTFCEVHPFFAFGEQGSVKAIKELQHPWILLGGFILSLLLMYGALAALDLSGSSLVFFILPVVLSALFFDRWAYLSLLAAWTAVALWSTFSLSGDFGSSLTCTLGGALSTLVIAELLYRQAASRKTLIKTLMAKEEHDRLLLEQLAMLHEIDQAILAALSVGEIAQAALSRIIHLIPSQQAGIIEFDLETRVVKVLATCSECQTPHRADALVPIIESSSEVLADKVIRIPNLAALPQRSPLEQTLYAEGVRSIISMPLITQREVIGALYLWADLPDALTEGHLEIATQVATSLAVAIRQARLREQAEQDARIKAKLARDANHRVGNNLATILGILNTQRRYMQVDDCPICQSLLDNLNSRIYGLATLHAMLSQAQWKSLQLSELCAQIGRAALQMLPPDKHLSLEVSPSSVYVSSEQASSLALIVNELVTNTVKHGLQEHDRGKISFDIRFEAPLVVLECRDDGPGYPEDVLQWKRHNAGLYLLPLFVHDELHGELALRNDHGAVTEIRFRAVGENG